MTLAASHRRRRPRVGALVRALASRGAGSVGQFVLLVVAGRMLGIEAVGQIFVTLAIGHTAAQAVNFGIARLALRRISLARSPDGELAVFRHAGLAGSAAAILAAGVAALTSAAPAVVSGLLLAALLQLLLIQSECLKAVGRPGTAICMEISLLPWVSLVLLVLFHAMGVASATAIAAALPLAGLGLFCLSLRILPGRASADRSRILAILRAERRRLFAFWISGLLAVGAARLGGLAAAGLTPRDAGTVAAIIGVASIGGTIVHAMQSVFAPIFARAADADDRDAVLGALALSQIACFLVFSVIAVPCLLAPAQVLALFGDGLAAYADTLLVVAILAQWLRSAAGCAEMLLAMSGRERDEAAALALAIVAFGAALLASSTYGAGEAVVLAFATLLIARGLFSAALAYRAAFRMFR